jgi:crotonobetainyl-CoA:carnitine CoA-transferase CaiB-like acyl-CoA transferase
MLKSVPDEDLGSVTLAGVVPKLSQTPGAICWPGRRIGQDTRALLRRLVNMPDAEIERLEREGVIHCDSGSAQAGPTSAPSGAFSN